MRRIIGGPAWLAWLALASGLYLAVSEFLGVWDWFWRI
jgi:hypothetical protein